MERCRRGPSSLAVLKFDVILEIDNDRRIRTHRKGQTVMRREKENELNCTCTVIHICSVGPAFVAHHTLVGAFLDIIAGNTLSRSLFRGSNLFSQP